MVNLNKNGMVWTKYTNRKNNVDNRSNPVLYKEVITPTGAGTVDGVG